jgi:cytochrome c-type biogenesis protein CcmH/NrfG
MLLTGAIVAVVADTSAGAGDRAAASGHWSAALASYGTATALAPVNPAYLVSAAEIAERAAEQTAPRVSRAARKHDYAVAVDTYRRALRLEPTDEAVSIELARTLTSRAAAIDARSFPEADAMWATIVSADPHDPGVHQMRAEALTLWANATGDARPRRLAASEFTSLVRLRPRAVDGWIDLGRTEAALGDTAAARRAARRALALSSHQPEALALLRDTRRPAA